MLIFTSTFLDYTCSLVYTSPCTFVLLLDVYGFAWHALGINLLIT